jgi:hypothetical protein
MKPNKRFLNTGKPLVKPNWLRRFTGFLMPGLKTLLVAFKRLF